MSVYTRVYTITSIMQIIMPFVLHLHHCKAKYNVAFSSQHVIQIYYGITRGRVLSDELHKQS